MTATSLASLHLLLLPVHVHAPGLNFELNQSSRPELVALITSSSVPSDGQFFPIKDAT